MAPISKKRHILEMSEYSSGMSNSFSDSDSNQGNYSEGSMSGQMSMMDASGRQYARVNRVILDKDSDEYRKRRERNNLAVKKSRTKSKLKSMQTMERVNLLKAENVHLKSRVDILSKELRLLKEIFVAHASNAHGTEITEFDLKLLTSADILEVPYSPSEPMSPAMSHHHLAPHHASPLSHHHFSRGPYDSDDDY